MWRHGDKTYPTTPTSLVDYFKSRLLNCPPATEVEEVVYLEYAFPLYPSTVIPQSGRLPTKDGLEKDFAFSPDPA